MQPHTTAGPWFSLVFSGLPGMRKPVQLQLPLKSTKDQTRPDFKTLTTGIVLAQVAKSDTIQSIPIWYHSYMTCNTKTMGPPIPMFSLRWIGILYILCIKGVVEVHGIQGHMPIVVVQEEVVKVHPGHREWIQGHA
jgi:hypothetical protein